jgi:hypothetical protein
MTEPGSPRPPADNARAASTVLATALTAVLGGCGFLGASEITVEAQNDSDVVMVVQVVEGIAAGGADYGPPHRLDPLVERELELAVPGGDWTVRVNGARLFESVDVGARRGRIPITIILPAPDAPVDGPFWRAPADWLDTGS